MKAADDGDTVTLMFESPSEHTKHASPASAPAGTQSYLSKKQQQQLLHKYAGLLRHGAVAGCGVLHQHLLDQVAVHHPCHS